MADITMCKGTNCPMSLNCKRYTARPNPHRQSYFTEVPLKDGKCNMYWDITLEELEHLTHVLMSDIDNLLIQAKCVDIKKRSSYLKKIIKKENQLKDVCNRIDSYKGGKDE